MSVFRRFESLRYPSKYGYIFNSDSFVSGRGRGLVSDKLLMFDTYGDGRVQHNAEIPITIEYLPDFLASAIPLLLEDQEFAEELAYRIDGQKPNDRLIEFALSIRRSPKPEIGRLGNQCSVWNGGRGCVLWWVQERAIRQRVALSAGAKGRLRQARSDVRCRSPHRAGLGVRRAKPLQTERGAECSLVQ